MLCVSCAATNDLARARIEKANLLQFKADGRVTEEPNRFL
jgi:hypothetical protein